MKAITQELKDNLNDKDSFTLDDAYSAVTSTNKEHSIRARIYEGVKIGIFKRLSRGVYTLIDNEDNSVVLIHGDGRDLSMLEDNSIDCIITDHPYKDDKSNKGGSRDFASYQTFKYNQEDFDEKARVLKEGSYLVEFFAEENSNNYEYIFKCKQFAKNAGLEYYTTVNWKKGSFVSNTGRKAKNIEQLTFFTKGKSRALKVNAKKNLDTLKENDIISKNEKVSSIEAIELINTNNLELSYMRGTAKMLPTEFDVNKTSKKETIHQAEKPVELFKQLLSYITLENETILDQFSGSGNSGLACLLTNRNAILIEHDINIYNTSKDNITEKLK